MAQMSTRYDVVVIGAGQAGLSAGYQLHRMGLRAERDFLMLDHSPQPGGAWQFRWPSLTLSTANNIHDLPGLALRSEDAEIPAAFCMPKYFAEYEEQFDLRVHRPVHTEAVRDGGAEEGGGRLIVATSEGELAARGVINATGTWEQPFIPFVPGIASSAAASCTQRTTPCPRSSRGSTSWWWAAVSRRCS
jgi:cation diffusion facilitator CzcD-associated flavoprotein CzcO